jgi:hypothetical protein
VSGRTRIRGYRADLDLGRVSLDIALLRYVVEIPVHDWDAESRYK